MRSTAAGKQLIESLRVETVSAHTRIGALQTAIVMISLGIALLLLRGRVSGAEEHFGTIMAPGLSSAASYYLSKSFGLLNGSRARPFSNAGIIPYLGLEPAIRGLEVEKKQRWGRKPLRRP